MIHIMHGTDRRNRTTAYFVRGSAGHPTALEERAQKGRGLGRAARRADVFLWRRASVPFALPGQKFACNILRLWRV